MKKLLINESVVNYKVILKTGEIKNLRGVMEYANESIKGILCISTKKDGFFEIESVSLLLPSKSATRIV